MSNESYMPGEVATQVFHCNFNRKTKKERRPRIYSMKLFGQEILGGNAKSYQISLGGRGCLPTPCVTIGAPSYLVLVVIVDPGVMRSAELSPDFRER